MKEFSFVRFSWERAATAAGEDEDEEEAELT